MSELALSLGTQHDPTAVIGEGVYKMHVTLGRERMGRVDDLGHATVPFRFSLYALFVDNALVLEAKLHAYFAVGWTTNFNRHKDFIRADLKEIEVLIHANYDAVPEVVQTAPGNQSLRHLKLTMPLERS